MNTPSSQNGIKPMLAFIYVIQALCVAVNLGFFIATGSALSAAAAVFCLLLMGVTLAQDVTTR